MECKDICPPPGVSAAPVPNTNANLTRNANLNPYP